MLFCLALMGLDRALNLLVPIFYRDIGEGEQLSPACWFFIELVMGCPLHSWEPVSERPWLVPGEVLPEENTD